MKLFVVALAAVVAGLALCRAEASPMGAAEPSVEYLPPADSDPESEAMMADADTRLADDGYRYKTVRRLKFRHRRDVSQEYLPPLEEPSQEYLPPAEETQLADDGYRYKTVRRLRLRTQRRRRRRDVSEIELPSNEYLPPVQVELAPDLKTILGDDGYRYKTVRRLKYRRHRREASAEPEGAVAAEVADNGVAADAAPSNEYLPPAEMPMAMAMEAPEQDSAVLANDGYRYKTVRRIRYRYRH